ncbi:MAG: hypothetical protein ACYDEI_00220 [Erysipelotrichaceae bacterium]
MTDNIYKKQRDGLLESLTSVLSWIPISGAYRMLVTEIYKSEILIARIEKEIKNDKKL